jgi:sugar lactone lactonase YvrE
MIRNAFILVLTCTSLFANAQKYTVTPAFELKEEKAIVEGMTFDPVGRHFYFGESTKKRILKYSEDGKVADRIGSDEDGLTSVLGMTVDRKKHHLWVCGAIKQEGKSIMAMFQYDLKNGKLISRYPDTSGVAKLFNDVAITDDGNVFCTDTYGRALYTIDPSKKYSVLFIKSDSLRDPNGITTDGTHLYVSTYPEITKVDTKTKAVSKLRLPELHIAGSDGLYFYKNSLIGIQNVFFPLSVVRYYMDDLRTRFTKGEVISVAHPSFVVPTTGGLDGDYFYMMSNNNIGKEKEEKVDRVKLVKIALSN